MCRLADLTVSQTAGGLTRRWSRRAPSPVRSCRRGPRLSAGRYAANCNRSKDLCDFEIITSPVNAEPQIGAPRGVVSIKGSTMSTSSPVVQQFFEQFERSRNTFDVAAVDSQYPDAFMFAGPDGPRVIQKTALLDFFSQGREFFKTLGHKKTELVSLDETRLDEHYARVRAQFVWRFEKAPAPPIDVEVDSTFILHFKDGVARIVFQHELEEFLHALRVRGVLAVQA